VTPGDVGEGDRVGLEIGGDRIERRHLPAPIELEDDVRPRLAGDRSGGVAAAVAGHHHPQELARVVEGEGVGDPPPDRRLLVVRRDREGDPRKLGGLGRGRRGPAAQPRLRREQQGIAHVRVDEQPDRGPEGDLD
jgi:hypothetical protein